MSAASEITFFYESFGVPTGYEYIAPANQIWQWKEFLNLLGLAGVFLFLFTFAAFILDAVPFFAELKAERALPAAPALSTKKSKVVYWLGYAINLIIPALLVMPVMFQLIGKESFVPFTATPWFGEANTNELAGWSLFVSIALLLVFLLSYFLFQKKQGVTTDSWGIKITAM